MSTTAGWRGPNKSFTIWPGFNQLKLYIACRDPAFDVSLEGPHAPTLASRASRRPFRQRAARYPRTRREIGDRCYFRGCGLLRAGRCNVVGTVLVRSHPRRHLPACILRTIPALCGDAPCGIPRSAKMHHARPDGCHAAKGLDVSCAGGPAWWRPVRVQISTVRRSIAVVDARLRRSCGMRASRRTHTSPPKGHTHPRAAFLHINPGHPDYLFTRCTPCCSSFPVRPYVQFFFFAMPPLISPTVALRSSGPAITVPAGRRGVVKWGRNPR